MQLILSPIHKVAELLSIMMSCYNISVSYLRTAMISYMMSCYDYITNYNISVIYTFENCHAMNFIT